MKKIFFLPVFILLILSLIGFVFAEQKCSLYFRDGVKEEHCANCGNGICEAYEECTSSNCGGNNYRARVCTADCGGLYCKEDCEKKAKCENNNDCGREKREFFCSGNAKCPKIIAQVCKNPGTKDSYCVEQEIEIKAPCIVCENGCKNGECVKSITNPDSICGNGVCENEFCKAKNCDGSDETKTCPKDCKKNITECTTNKECWDKFKSCYYKCDDGKCIQINTILPLPDYPDCERTLESISIKIPSSFSLVKEQTAKVANYQDMKIKLTGIFTNPECKTEPCPLSYFREYVKIEVSTPGGCGANADPRCLGPPAYFNEFTIRENESVEILGIKMILKQINEDKAEFYVEFLLGKLKEKNVKTKLELSEEKIDNKTKVNVKLSNGKKSEIKIMPETASEKAIEVLKLKICSEENNCTIELKEVGKNNKIRAIYKIEAEKQGKFLGLFKIKSKLETQIDAETGEVIRIKKPWWRFLVFEF